MSGSPTTSHRRGRKTNFTLPATGKRATAEDFSNTAADDNASIDVARSAVFAVRLLDPAGKDPEIGLLSGKELAETPITSLMPVRRPPSFRGMRNYIGRLSFVGSGDSDSVWFESLNELGHWRDLLVSARVTHMTTQPFRIDWQLTTGRRSHWPDAVLRLDDGSTLMVDITTRRKLASASAVRQFALTATTARVLGWRYELRTELPGQRVVNLSALWSCRHADPEVHSALLTAAQTLYLPRQLEHVVTRLAAIVDGYWAVQHLLANGDLWADLDQPITPRTLVHQYPTPPGRAPWQIDL